MIKYALENKVDHVIFFFIPMPEENTYIDSSPDGITLIKTDKEVENCIKDFGLNLLPKKPPEMMYVWKNMRNTSFYSTLSEIY